MAEFTFIDLFAGIGGFRLACEAQGGECVFSSEIDKHACDTYEDNFGERPAGDITKINSGDIPRFDLLCAGFPCQSFSMAGKRLGFDDVRGTLVFDIARIIRDKRPRMFLLENVKGLVSHDEGRTLEVILNLFGRTFNKTRVFFPYEDNLGYNVFHKVLNAADFGVPQNRYRIFIVGFREDVGNWGDFRYPKKQDSSMLISDILEDVPDEKYFLSDKEINSLAARMEGDNTKLDNYRTKFKIKKPNEKCYTLTTMDGQKGLTGIPRVEIEENEGKCNKRIMKMDEKLSTVMQFFGHKGLSGPFQNTGLEIGNRIRVFTPRECARLQGFPDTFRMNGNEKQAYRQFGNSVAVPCVIAMIKEIKKILVNNNEKEKS